MLQLSLDHSKIIDMRCSRSRTRIEQTCQICTFNTQPSRKQTNQFRLSATLSILGIMVYHTIIAACWITSSSPDPSSRSVINVLHSCNSDPYFPHIYHGQFLLSSTIFSPSTWFWIRAVAPRIQIWGKLDRRTHLYEPISHCQYL